MENQNNSTNSPATENNIEELKKRAEQGDKKAQYLLGKSYEKEGDWKNAIEWLEKSSNQDYVKAQYRLGLCYTLGKGVEKDRGKALEYFKKAAQHDHAESLYFLGMFYAQGTGVKKDWAKAVSFFKKVSNKLDDLFINDDRKLFVKNAVLAESGNAESQYLLGKLFEQGKGVSKSLGSAIKWFAKAAKQDYPRAQYFLGMYYVKGEGLEENWRRAIFFFKKIENSLDILNIDEDHKVFIKNALLAESGDTMAQYSIGLDYLDGNVVKADSTNAAKWFNRIKDKLDILNLDESTKSLVEETIIAENEKLDKDFEDACDNLPGCSFDIYDPDNRDDWGAEDYEDFYASAEPNYDIYEYDCYQYDDY